MSKVEKNGTHLHEVLDLSSILDGNEEEQHTIGVMINFNLDKAVLTSIIEHKQPSENTLLYGRFTGNDFTTQIKGRYI